MTIKEWNVMNQLKRMMLILVFMILQLSAQNGKMVFTGAHIIPITGDEISNGFLIIENGEISIG